ncbi:MAG: zinc ribbon domain-containing protein [Clostridium sp.]|nr:zinc ribbon domain-containing protein [Clostridium sp.]
MTAVGGVSVYGGEAVPPHPAMILTLLLPIGIIFLLSAEKFTEKKTASVIALCAAVDLAVWMIFRGVVKKVAAETYCEFRTTGWYVLNLASIIAVFLLAILIRKGRLKLESDLSAILAAGKSHNIWRQIPSVISNVTHAQEKKNAIGFCCKCGNPITYGCKFCTACGTPVPESIFAEGENRKKEEGIAGKQEKENAEKAGGGSDSARSMQ